MGKRISVARHWQGEPLINAKPLGIPQSFSTPFVLRRTNDQDPLFRYLLGNEFRGEISEVAKSQAHFSASHHIAYLETVRGAQIEACIPVSGGKTPQLFHDGSARKRPHDRKRNHAVILSLQGLHRLCSVLERR